jgi:hypothetical protein
MLRPFLHLALGALASILAWHIAAFAAYSVIRPSDSLSGLLYAAIVLSLAAGAGGWVVYALHKRFSWTWPHLPRTVGWALIGAYLITWVFGVPAIQTRDTRFSIERWNRNKALGRDVHKSPSVYVVAALPIAPGLVLSYQAVTIGPLDGWEAWTLHLWYGWGAAELYDLTLAQY